MMKFESGSCIQSAVGLKEKEEAKRMAQFAETGNSRESLSAESSLLCG